MIRGLNGEPDDMTEEYDQYWEEKAEAVGLIPNIDIQEDMMPSNCRHEELDGNGVLAESCLRSASFVVESKAYCHSHVVEARLAMISSEYKKKQEETGG